MTYKEEKQIKLGEKLQKIFDEENVPDFIQDYFQDIASRTARINYWITIRDMLNWLISKKYIDCDNISEITPEMLDKITKAKIIIYFDELKRTIKLSTLKTKKNHLGSFWEHLKTAHYCRDNIIHAIKSEEYKPARTNRLKITKTPLHEDIEEMINKIDGKSQKFIRIRNMTVFRTLRGTGLRESELCGLNINDVYLDEKYISKRTPRPYILVISKGTYDYSDEGKDIVFLTNDATIALKEWLEYRKTLDLKTDALFVNKTGNRMLESDVQKMFKVYSNRKITPHMMRHEYTTVLMRETNDPTFVREQGRWKSDAMMNNVYDSGTKRSIDVLKNM